MLSLSDLHASPALLKLDLYCQGMQVDPSCFVEEDGGRGIMRTRAGLGSGLELILPGGLWTNVPVVEQFATRSPYVLHRTNGHYVVRRDAETVAEVQLSPRPIWYDRKTSSGKPMTRVGTLQGTYLGVYPAKVCDYWLPPTKTNCKFCSVGLNLGVDDATEKSVDEVMEVVHAARGRLGHHVRGLQHGPLRRRDLPRHPRALHPPHQDGTPIARGRADAAASRTSRATIVSARWVSTASRSASRSSTAGASRKSVRASTPTTGSIATWTRFAIAPTSASGGRRSEPWVTNGEIIAGLEPPESSIRAIEWMTSVGAIPTVCVFRPLRGTDFEAEPPPNTEDLIPVFRRLYESCMEHKLPIGCAPNVHVSLVLLPEECASLSSRRYPMQRLKLGLIKRAVAARFAWQARAVS